MNPGYIVPLVGMEVTPSAASGAGDDASQTAAIIPSVTSIRPWSITESSASMVTILPSSMYEPLWTSSLTP